MCLRTWGYWQVCASEPSIAEKQSKGFEAYQGELLELRGIHRDEGRKKARRGISAVATEVHSDAGAARQARDAR